MSIDPFPTPLMSLLIIAVNYKISYKWLKTAVKLIKGLTVLKSKFKGIV